jgi:hypothetical protein
MTPNVDLKSDAASLKETSHSRKMTLKFIFVTPRALIEKEGREHKLARVNFYLKTGNTFELLGHKEDFRCYNNATRSVNFYFWVHCFDFKNILKHSQF